MIKVAIKTLGCRVNIAESQKWISDFLKFGFKVVNDKADLYIVNSCAVTNKAEKESRQIIHQIKKLNQNAKIILTGCYKPELGNKVFLTIPAIDKEKLVEIVKQKLKIQNSKIKIKNRNSKFGYYRTRAFVKVQDGCNNFCSYCIIPHFRNLSRSKNTAQILKEIKDIEKQGYKEIILCGINLGNFNDNGIKIADLVELILAKTKIPRIRISSINPNDISDKLINLFKNPRLMPHLHIPLQSGSDKILKLMKRNYTADDYLKIIKKITKKYPLFGFSTDIIVGFPNETEKDFKATIKLIKKIPFLKIHIFRFSPRPKTLAYILNNKNSVPEKIKKQRFNILKNLSDEISKNYKEKFIGKKMPVLFEQKHADVQRGYAPNYLLIQNKSKRDLTNKIMTVIYKNII